MKKLLKYVRETPWFITASRFCLVNLAVLLLLLIRHMAENGFACFSDISVLTGSAQPPDTAMKLLYIAWAIAGCVLCLGRKEVRKNSALCFACLLVPAAVFRRSGSLQGWLTAAAFASPAVFALLFERIHGQSASGQWKHEQEKRKKTADEMYPAGLTPRELRREYRREYRPFRLTDAAVIFLLSVTAAGMLLLAADTVRKGEAGFPIFTLAGIPVILLLLYLVSLLRLPVPAVLLGCRFLWGLTGCILMLCVLRVFRHGGIPAGFSDLHMDQLLDSAEIPDQLLAGLIFLHGAVSVWMTLVRRETRKTVALALPLWLLGIGLMVGMDLPGNSMPRTWQQLLGDLAGLLWPMFAGLLAMLFEPLWGNSLRQEWLVSHMRGRQRRELNQSVPSSRSVSSSAPRQAAPQPVPSSPAPPQRAGAPAAAPVPAQAPAEERRDSREDPGEAHLRRLKEKYEMKQAAQQSGADFSSERLMPEAARRLFPGGEMLSTLDGQRQLLVWLTEGVPCLKPVRDGAAVRALMDPELPDDPERFLPVLNQVAEEVAACLKRDLWDDPERWRSLQPEQLLGGWFALNMYARMSSEPELFQLAADAVAEYENTRDADLRWLASAAGMEDRF